MDMRLSQWRSTLALLLLVSACSALVAFQSGISERCSAQYHSNPHSTSAGDTVHNQVEQGTEHPAVRGRKNKDTSAMEDTPEYRLIERASSRPEGFVDESGHVTPVSEPTHALQRIPENAEQLRLLRRAKVTLAQFLPFVAYIAHSGPPSSSILRNSDCRFFKVCNRICQGQQSCMKHSCKLQCGCMHCRRH